MWQFKENLLASRSVGEGVSGLAGGYQWVSGFLVLRQGLIDQAGLELMGYIYLHPECSDSLKAWAPQPDGIILTKPPSLTFDS